MSCYRTILVAVDGSVDATAALRHAATLARDQHAKLIVLTVVPSSAPVPSTGVVVLSAAENDAAYARVLREAVDPLPQDIGVETRIGRGRPAGRILETARDCGCDLIVMGAHGHGRLHHALIGSVSDAVLRGSDVPVLLMRAAERRVDPADDGARAVVAYSGPAWP